MICLYDVSALVTIVTNRDISLRNFLKLTVGVYNMNQTKHQKIIQELEKKIYKDKNNEAFLYCQSKKE